LALAAHQQPDPRLTLAKAVSNAGRALGLSQEVVGRAIGRDRSALHRGLAPDGKAGELGLLLVRLYRSLYVLVGGGEAEMRHWMHTPNRDTGGVPAEQVCTVQGLVEVVGYLDAMRGKV
jgi:hypothetical protein